MCKGGLWDSERCAVCCKEIHAWPLSESELSEQRDAVAREVLAARKRAEAELRKRPAMLQLGMSPADFHKVSSRAGEDSSSESSEGEDVFGSDVSSSSEDDVVVEAAPRLQCLFTQEGRLGISFQRNSVPPLAIAKIAPDTLAAADLRLRVGMALVELQGESTTGMPYDMVIAKIRQAGRPLSMVFEHTWISSGA